MSETTDLTVIEIKPEQAPALYIPNGLDAYLEHIKASVSEAPDLSTDKGRKRIASLSASVSRSKTLIEKPGREYLKRLKEAVKPAEQEIKRFVDACDALRDEVRRPLTEWEMEQERIRIEEEAKKAAQELAIKIEADHEIALLMNDKFDRDAADAKAEAERQRIAHEEELKRQAVEQAQREADEKIQREREASAKREADLKAHAELAERERLGAIKQAEEDKRNAEIRHQNEIAEAAEREIVAAANAEREKQEAIAAEQLNAQQEAQRIQREAKQKEDARLAEEKRIADEAAKRAADKAYQAEVNNAAIAVLTKAGIDPECAKQCVIAIIKNQINAVLAGEPAPVQINY